MVMVDTILHLNAAQDAHIGLRVHIRKGAARTSASSDGGNAQVEVGFVAPAVGVVAALR
jgi:hypothetical protein